MRYSLTLLFFLQLTAATLCAAQNSTLETKEASLDSLPAAYTTMLPNTDAAKELLRDAVTSEGEFLESALALQTTEGKVNESSDEKIAALIEERIKQLRSAIKNRPRSKYGLSSYEVLDNYEARLTAVFIVLAQHPVPLREESYSQLEWLMAGLFSRVKVDPRASGPFIEDERYAAFTSVADRALRNVSTPSGYLYGIQIAMRFKWEDTAMSLAREVAKIVDEEDYAAKQGKTAPDGTAMRNWIGEAAFLAAHAFLVWGDASDARLIANLMDETYSRKMFAVVSGGGPTVYSVADMAAMASVKVANGLREGRRRQTGGRRHGTRRK